MRAAYLDCFSGASGDMLLGALLDAGLDFTELESALAQLPLRGYHLSAQRVMRAGLAAMKADVAVTGPQPERTLAAVLAIIDAASLPHGDKESGTAIFRRLAEAEAHVHGCDIQEVRLHDVGAVDAIADVMGAVCGLRLLGVEVLFASALAVGGGSAQGPHGRLPAPAPATLQLLAQAGAPLRPGTGEPDLELLTPTAAAIITTLARFERPSLRLQRVGYGAGTRDIAGQPNVLRLWLGDLNAESNRMALLETNIDDSPPELLGFVQEKLLQLGAADVWFTPVQMKKNRPGVILSLICRQEMEAAAVDLLLTETTTLGVRSRPLQRWEAQREEFVFESTLGPAAVKVKRLPGRKPQVSAEYEACRRLAEQTGMPLAEVYRVVEAEALARLAADA